MTWTIDPSHSSVGFKVRHLGLSTVRGRFTEVRIEDVSFDPADVTTARGRVLISTASVSTGDGKRDGHLSSPDFFDAPTHPDMVFEVTGVEGSGDEYRVRGSLTIKGISREVELTGEFLGDAQDPYGNHKAGFSVNGEINRTDWGLSWNVPLDAGRLLVGEKVKLEIEIQLLEQAAVAAGA